MQGRAFIPRALGSDWNVLNKTEKISTTGLLLLLGFCFCFLTEAVTENTGTNVNANTEATAIVQQRYDDILD